MPYNIKEARKQAFEQFHEALNTPERLEKIVKTFDSLLELGSMRLQAFTVGVLIDILFQPDQDGAIIRSRRLNDAAHEKLGNLVKSAVIDNEAGKG